MEDENRHLLLKYLSSYLKKCCFYDLETEQDPHYLQWYEACEVAITSLFQLCQRYLCLWKEWSLYSPDVECEGLLHFLASTIFSPTQTALSSRLLSRFIFILGHMALKLLVFVEALSNEAKKQRQKQMDALKERNKEENKAEEEMGIVGSVEDIEEQMFENIAKYEIVNKYLSFLMIYS